MSLSKEEVRALVKRSKSGDKEALESLIQEYRERIHEFVRKELGKHLRRKSESEDLVQQACLAAIKEIERYEEKKDGSFFGWLKTIALNRIRDLHRREFQAKKRKGEIRTGDMNPWNSALRLLEKISGSGTSPSMAMNRQDMIRCLEEALGKLPRSQEEAIRLRYFSQLTVEEAAERMGKTEASVRALCVRAIVKLRGLLKDVL